MTKRNRRGKGIRHIKDIGLREDKPSCACEFCQVSEAAHEFGRVGDTIYAFRMLQISSSEQARILEVSGLNVVRVGFDSFIVTADWLQDDTIDEYVKGVIGIEPVILKCRV